MMQMLRQLVAGGRAPWRSRAPVSYLITARPGDRGEEKAVHLRFVKISGAELSGDGRGACRDSGRCRLNCATLKRECLRRQCQESKSKEAAHHDRHKQQWKGYRARRRDGDEIQSKRRG